MPTTSTVRPILDLKRWDFCTPAPVSTLAGSFIANSRHYKQQHLYVNSNTTAWLYDLSQDGFIAVPSPALAGTFGSGAAGTSSAYSLGAAIGSTTIAAGSNNAALPQSTINVGSTTGFPLAGAIYVDTADRGRQLITYTSVISATQFGGCSGGAGTLLTNQAVSLAGLTALAGTTNTIVTNQLLARDLRGYSLHVMSGPNAGATIQILGNTTSTGSTTIAAGSNGLALPQATLNVASTAGFPVSGQLLVTISGAQQIVSYTGITATSFTGCSGGSGTLATSQAVQFASTITLSTQANAFSTATVFRLMTPTWWVVGAGTLAAGSFRKYDFATNTWTSGTITGLPATIGTDSCLVSTPSWVDSSYKQFATGTATSGSNTTLVVTGKTWTINQWANYQIRIVGGTGAGQIRPIASNTADTITVSGWNANPDSTSTYSIEGNDDNLYYLGNAAVTMYRYSIAGNAWATLSPNAARAVAPGTGMSGEWIHSVTDSAWTNETSVINGRRLYSFRGGASGLHDYYDIPTNTWISANGPQPSTETFATGTKWAYRNDYWYCQKDATGRWFRYDFARNTMEPWNTMLYPNSTAFIGNTAFAGSYFDGSTEIIWIYMILNSSSIMLRQMVIG